MNKLHNIFLMNVKCFIILFDDVYVIFLPSSFLLQRNSNNFWACRMLKDTRFFFFFKVFLIHHAANLFARRFKNSDSWPASVKRVSDREIKRGAGKKSLSVRIK